MIKIVKILLSVILFVITLVTAAIIFILTFDVKKPGQLIDNMIEVLEDFNKA